MAEKKTTTRGRKKAETVKEPIVEKDIEKEINDDLQKELKKANEEKNAMADMLKQMQEQMAQMQNQLNNQNNGNNQVVIKQNEDITRTVKVISMLPNTYNLWTREYGVGGKTYTFKKFGDEANIKFGDMQDILALRTADFEKGYAVLTNKKDYDDLSIGYIWDEILTKDKMEKIVNLEGDEAVNIILGMEEDMQEKIAGNIARKIADGYSYDYNKIKALEDEGIEINELVEMLQAEEKAKKIKAEQE